MTEAWKVRLLQFFHSKELFKVLKREFDRSFTISVDEQNGKLKVVIEDKDSGQEVMTVADVAAYLQCDRASVRRMTGERAQRRSHHPIPFIKIGAKMLRFSRPAIETWWATMCESPNGKNNTSVLTLTKGKIKKGAKR